MGSKTEGHLFGSYLCQFFTLLNPLCHLESYVVEHMLEIPFTQACGGACWFGWCPAPRVTFRLVVAPLRGPGQSPLLPFACCVVLLLSVGRLAGALASVVSAFAERSSWCVGAVLNVAWCAVCALAAPKNWRIEDVLVIARVV